MTNPILVNLELLEFIPQRPPIVMVDVLYNSSKGMTVTGLTIHEDNIFISGKHLDTTGLVENMAQTAAVGAGYHAVSNSLKVRVGFIGAIKNLEVFNWPKVGDVIVTEIKEKHQIGDVKIVQGTVRLEDAIIANCELKIFLEK